MNERQTLGRWGESLAAIHLEAKGYQIVTRNWRCQYGEVDLVAKTGAEWVFVEVKTRRGQTMGAPEEALTAVKQRKMVAVAEEYLLAHDLDADWRVDLVAVELDSSGKLLRCDHIPNVVLGW